MTAPAQDPRRMIRKLNLVGLAITVLLVGGVGGWATTTQLAGAVIAPGTIVVESNVKKVQHPTGGVVGEILVKEGSEVDEGQIVLRLDDTVTRSTLGVVRSQLDEFMAREARLLAERDDASAIVFPAQLTNRGDDTSATMAVAGEEKLFESRKTARDRPAGAIARTYCPAERGDPRCYSAAGSKGKRTQANRGGARWRRRALPEESRFAFRGTRNSSATRRGCRASAVSSSPTSPARAARSARPSCKLSKSIGISAPTCSRICARRKARSRNSRNALPQLRISSSASICAHRQAGIVHQLAVHTVGGVISNAETIMQIVPRADELVVEAKVAPSDIDQVATGATAVVRIMAGNQRTQPEIKGVLTRVSADLAREPQQQNSSQPPPAYYTVRVALPAAEVARLKDIRLLPGMPAEVFIQTHERTPLQYLLKPLHEQIARTFRER